MGSKRWHLKGRSFWNIIFEGYARSPSGFCFGYPSPFLDPNFRSYMLQSRCKHKRCRSPLPFHPDYANPCTTALAVLLYTDLRRTASDSKGLRGVPLMMCRLQRPYQMKPFRNRHGVTNCSWTVRHSPHIPLLTKYQASMAWVQSKMWCGSCRSWHRLLLFGGLGFFSFKLRNKSCQEVLSELNQDHKVM